MKFNKIIISGDFLRGGEQQGANTQELTQMGLALIEKSYQSASQKECLSCDTASFHPFIKRENQQAPQDQQ